jgi:hypothetical protein
VFKLNIVRKILSIFAIWYLLNWTTIQNSLKFACQLHRLLKTWKFLFSEKYNAPKSRLNKPFSIDLIINFLSIHFFLSNIPACLVNKGILLLLISKLVLLPSCPFLLSLSYFSLPCYSLYLVSAPFILPATYSLPPSSLTPCLLIKPSYRPTPTCSLHAFCTFLAASTHFPLPT